MPHLVELDYQRPAFWRRFRRVFLGELLYPVHHAGRRYAQELRRPVHRQAAHVEQHRQHLDLEWHPSRRRVGEVQAAALAAVALLAAHEAVLDLLLGPAPLAAQPHRPAPSAIPPPTDMGDLRNIKTLVSDTPQQLVISIDYS